MNIPHSTLYMPKSASEVSAILASANENGLKVVPCGTRTKLDRGAPPERCDILLDLSLLTGVIEHAAGDLTVTARAGTRLADLQAVLAGHGQFLAVDPPVPGTLGGLIATGDSGPRRLRYGGVRDLLLGVSFVRADGVIAKGGGKVVKNVAGYDLPKLMTGSLGTLGVIVEATFRLYPLPASSATTVIETLPVLAAGEAAQSILSSQLTPTSFDYFCSEAGSTTLAVRFEGPVRSVDTQAEIAVRLWGKGSYTLAGDAEVALWSIFGSASATDADDVLARLISPVTALPPLIEAAQHIAGDLGIGMTMRAHMGHGHALLRLHRPIVEKALTILGTIRQQAETSNSNLILWSAPDGVREHFDVWGDAGEGLSLMHRIKAQFDPKRTLNPGRFVGGI